MIRVLLVNDQRLVRAGLRMLCESAPDLEVVGEAENGQQAVQLAGRLLPDVVLMDLRMPGVDGIAATGRILAAHPLARIVVLTTFDDDDHLYPALAAGACGFLVKDAEPAELLDRVRRAGTARSARLSCVAWSSGKCWPWSAPDCPTPRSRYGCTSE